MSQSPFGRLYRTVAVPVVLLSVLTQFSYCEESRGPNLLLLRARECRQNGDFERAIWLLRTLTLAYPNHDFVSKAQLEIGNCFAELTNYDVAIRELQKVVNSHPGSANQATAHFSLAWCYRRQGQDDKALEEYEKFLRHPLAAPDLMARAHWWIAEISYLQKDYSKVIKEYSLIRKKFPGTKYAESAESRLSFLMNHPEHITTMIRSDTFPANFSLWMAQLELDLAIRSRVLWGMFRGAKWCSVNLAVFLLCLLIVLVVRVVFRSAKLRLGRPLLEYRRGIAIYIYAVLSCTVCIILGTVVTDRVLGSWGGSFVSPMDDLLVAGLMGIMFLAVPVAYLALKRIPLSDIGLTRYRWRVGGIVKWSLLGFLLFVGALIAYTLLCLPWAGAPITEDSPANSLIPEVVATKSPVLIGVLLVFFLLIVPVGEEVSYRGVVYSSLKGRVGRLGAAVISALLFSVNHFSVSLLLYYLMGGLVFALLYERTKSLYPSIILHSILNLVVTLRLWLGAAS